MPYSDYRSKNHSPWSQRHSEASSTTSEQYSRRGDYYHSRHNRGDDERDRERDRERDTHVPPPPPPATAAPATETQKLPPNWRIANAQDGTLYYYNETTLETRWTLPTDEDDGGATANKITEEQIQAIVEKASIARMLKEKAAREQEQAEATARLLAEKKEARKKERMSNRPNNVGSGHRASLSVSSPSIHRMSTSPISTPPSTTLNEDAAAKAMRAKIAPVVTKYMSAFKNDIPPEKFKKHARELTHALMEKEAKSSSFAAERWLDSDVAVDGHHLKKMKTFIKEYMEKLVTRERERARKKRNLTNIYQPFVN